MGRRDIDHVVAHLDHEVHGSLGIETLSHRNAAKGAFDLATALEQQTFRGGPAHRAPPQFIAVTGRRDSVDDIGLA